MVRRSWSARDIVDLTAYHASSALLTAAALGVFDALSGRRATAAAVARRTGCDPGAMARLLGVLTGMGLLRHDGSKFGLAPGVRDLLAEDGGRSLADLLRHRAARFAIWARLEESLRTGSPVEAEADDDATSLRAARARRDTARIWAPVVAQMVDLGAGRSLLVLGDGAAVYGAHFARTRSRLAVTVVDRGASLEVGRGHVAGRPERSRIRFIEAAPDGSWEPGARFDAAFLADALHGSTPEAVQRLLVRVRSALAPGGRLFLRDRFLAGGGPSDLANALYDLQLLLTTEGGRCHRLADAIQWVRAAGFRKVEDRRGAPGDEFRVLCALVDGGTRASARRS